MHILKEKPNIHGQVLCICFDLMLIVIINYFSLSSKKSKRIVFRGIMVFLLGSIVILELFRGILVFS
jgi:hypothetical protein